MANNIAVSITADVADLQVKRAIMSAELRTATKDLNSYAAEAQKSGQTDELRTSMLTAADAVARYKNQIADNERRQKELRSEFTAQAAAMRAQATAMETENQAAQKLSVNYQAIINASTGVDIATRSAAESASVFEQVLGVQSQRAQEVRARLQQLEEQQQGSVAMTGQQSTSAQKLSVNYQAIINASTGVNAATRSAAESASVFEQALGVQSQRAQDLRARMQQLEEQQQGSVAMTGQQRQAMIVVGEQFRQVGTEVALGIPAMQIFAQQSGQTIQALSMAASEGSKMAAFLGSGLGIAAVTAVSTLAPLIASMIELGSAEDKALEKMKEDYQNTLSADAAKARFQNTIEGVEQAIRAEDEALGKQAESLKTVAQRSYDVAEGQQRAAQEIRRTTVDLLRQAEAEYEVTRSRAQGLDRAETLQRWGFSLRKAV
jgi:hypothetical protein